MLLLASVIALVAVWVPRLLSARRWRRLTGDAATFLLTPTGHRPDDLAGVGSAIAAVANQLGGTRGSGVTVHRYRDDQVVRVALTVYGHDHPDRIAQQVAASINATATPHDLKLPSATTRLWYVRRLDYRGRPPSDTELPSPARLADWVSTQMSAASDGACVSATMEPVREADRQLLRRWHMARAGRADDMEGVGPGRSLTVRIVTLDPVDDAGAQNLAGGTVEQQHRFPFNTTARPVTSVRTALANAVACLPATLSAPPLSFVAVAVTAGALIAAATMKVGVPSPLDRATARDLELHQSGVVPIVRTPLISPMRAARYVMGLFAPDGNVQMVGRQRSVGYPYPRTVLVMNSQQAAMLLALPSAHDASSVRAAASDVGAAAEIVTSSRDTSDAAGSLIGHDQRGQPVRFLDIDRKHGVFIAGEAGSGKSVAVARLFQQDAAARTDPIARRRNGQSAMVWFETKGQGADEAEQALRDADYPDGAYLRLDLNAHIGPRLELLDRNDPAGTADRLVGALTYAFETGSVGPRAAEALQAAFTLALHITPDIADAAGMGHERPNIMWATVLLLQPTKRGSTKHQLLRALHFAANQQLRDHTSAGTRSRQRDQDLAQLGGNSTPGQDGIDDHIADLERLLAHLEHDDQQQPAATPPPTAGPSDTGTAPSSYAAAMAGASNGQHSEQPPAAALTDQLATSSDQETSPVPYDIAATSTGVPLFDALRTWLYYEDAFTPREWASVFESPRNKIAAIARTQGLWTPDASRPEVTFHDLLHWHGVMILNTGASPFGRADDLTRQRLAAVCLYLLWQDIQRTCTGWLDQGRAIGLYSDELSALSGTGSGTDVIREMRDLGRAYGVQPTFATQRLDQLPQRTASSALGFGTRMYFQTESIDAASDAASDLNGGEEGPWSTEDLRGLDVGQAITRMRLHGAGQPPFVLQVALPDRPDTSERSHPTASLPAATKPTFEASDVT